jgi:hypothetical protein
MNLDDVQVYINEFVSLSPSDDKDDRYQTSREVASDVLTQFYEFVCERDKTIQAIKYLHEKGYNVTKSNGSTG